MPPKTVTSRVGGRREGGEGGWPQRGRSECKISQMTIPAEDKRQGVGSLVLFPHL